MTSHEDKMQLVWALERGIKLTEEIGPLKDTIIERAQDCRNDIEAMGTTLWIIVDNCGLVDEFSNAVNCSLLMAFHMGYEAALRAHKEDE